MGRKKGEEKTIFYCISSYKWRNEEIYDLTTYLVVVLRVVDGLALFVEFGDVLRLALLVVLRVVDRLVRRLALLLIDGVVLGLAFLLIHRLAL